MHFANTSMNKFKKFLKFGLKRFRRFVLWIPIFALIVGTTISVYVYESLRLREQQILKTDSIQRYKEMIRQLDLVFSNSILRVQSYEEYLGSRPRALKSDAVFMRQALEYTVFQRFVILENTHKKENGTPYEEIRVLLRLDSKNSTLEPTPSNIKTVRSDVVKEALRRMIEGRLQQEAVLHNYNEVPRVTFIMRSRENNDTFFAFTAPLSGIVAKMDLRPGESLEISDAKSGLSWRVEGQEDGLKAIYPNPPDAKVIYPEGYHHYLDIEGLPQSGLKLDFDFHFKAPKRELSPSMIAGFMSLLITLIIAYLFFVLVRQNSLVTRLVIEKTTDLEKAHHEMQEVLLGKTRFLGNISHEIRTPLNLILGMIDLCEEEDKDHRMAEYLKSMRASGNHLLSMIEDLLDLAKSDSNDMQVNLKKVNLLQFLDETARIAGQDSLKKNLRFYAKFAADLPERIECDPSRLRQILMNLLRNASKYTNHGHVVLRVSRVADAGSKTTIRFDIEDTGVGIPDDKIGKVFDAFFQVEGSYALAEGGVGLGLAIVKELVRKMGGRISVESKAKKGSNFGVEFDFENLDSQTWLEAFRPADEKTCELIVITNDPFWRRSVGVLGQHSKVNLNFVKPEDAKNYLENHHADGPRWILVDSALEGFSISQIKHDANLRKVIVAGSKRKLADFVGDSQAVAIDNSPLLATDILSHMGFNNRSKKRAEKNEVLVAPVLPAAPQVSASPISLIVADDDVGNKELYMAYFSKTQWQVEFAMNGKEAWDLYLSKPSDVLVLDLRMPIMDGFEVVEKVREYEVAHKLASKPILLVTADALESTAEKALSLPKVSFLTKPIKKSVLFDSIQKALS